MKYQTLFKEYVWLVNTIAKHKRITLEEINRLWCKTEMSGGVEMARSTFNRHKDAIEDIFGIYIDCNRKDGYRYHIGNAEELRQDTIQNWMLSTLAVHNMLTDNKSIHNRILLESIPSSGDYLTELTDAMKHNLKVRIVYRKYSQASGDERLISPFCVKLYRRRWYVLAQIDNGEMRCFSLDRIIGLTTTDESFTLPENFDANAYFHDVIGVMIESNKKAERIVVRAYGQERFYLRDLPIHSTQRSIGSTSEYTDFEFHIVPTADFIAHLLSCGGVLQVLSPQWFADKIQETHLKAASIYEKR